ncbi:MAG: NusA-like transcription termination signal-binding factor [Candidatus Micrarchaeia archaeon]|jgi:N utilization substance protein A
MPVLNNDDLQIINLLDSRTGARAVDVVVEAGEIIFVVKKGDLGRAIGKQGINIARLRQAFGKNIEIIEDADDAKGFLKNAFYPAQVKSIEESEIGGKKVAVIVVDAKSKGLAIGKGGEKIKRARMLAKRRYGIDDVKIL